MRSGTGRAQGHTRRSAASAALLAVAIAVGQASLAVAGQPVDSAGPPSADGVQPQIRDTRSSNDDCIELGFDHGLSIGGNGRVSTGPLTVTVSGYGSPTGFVDWSSTLPIHGVYVKGGPSGGDLFPYPTGDTGDQDLHTPRKSDGGYYAVSHVAFCWNDLPAEPDVTIRKANEPASVVVANETLAYTLTVTNEGEGDATDVVAIDPLPAGVTFVSATSGCTEAAGTVTCSAGDIGPGGTVELEILVSVNEGTCGAIDNVAHVAASNETAPANGNNGSNAVSNAVGCAEPSPPDVQVTKTSSADGMLSPGDTFTYTITVTNVGDEDATGVRFVDALPPDDPLSVDLSPWPTFGGEPCTLASSSPAGGTSRTTLHCGPITLGPGATASTTFDVTVSGDGCGPITNAVDVEAANEPPASVGSDDHDEVTDEIACAPRIRVVKGGPDLAHVGDTVTYAFAVTNPGSVDLSDVVLSDPRCDSAIELVDDGDGDTTLAIGERWDYRCDHTIAAGEDPVENTAAVEGTHEGGTVSDTDDHRLDVIHPEIGIGKTVSPTSGAPGTEITYTYVVTNLGDTPLFDINVSDDVLGQIGVIPSLPAGASTALTHGFTLGTVPVTNVGTASGEDVLGRVVSADDATTVTVVAAGGTRRPGTGSPFTGIDVQGAIRLAVVLLGAGSAFVARTRRRSGEPR